MDLKPIPAFYCCYLLRSTIRHSSLYVGSTPHPLRRLAQHNGVSKGGAARTAKANLRPWEMACIVTGFPSSIGALQFEWAWQNTHLTRHIPAAQRITESHTTTRISSKTGESRRRPARPRASMVDKLANLHLLLRVDSFTRWPLEVVFYSRAVYALWERLLERVDGQVRSGLKVSLVLPPNESDTTIATSEGGIDSIDVTYKGLTNHLERSAALLNESTADGVLCAICHGSIDSQETAATCPSDACSAASHLTCLSAAFLSDDEDKGAVVPSKGICPGCKREHKWVDVVKELSLRLRGEKEVKRLLKKPLVAKKPRDKRQRTVPSTPSDAGVISDSASNVDNEDENGTVSDDDDMTSNISTYSRDVSLSAGPDEDTTEKGPLSAGNQRIPIVIDDSDDSDAATVR
ncbi:MAG: hypothetical protein M1825_005917 [Sarcosagium campestre]|nr:MAG: hypothetical protein M1825_005917 [Sarcosagium campestre]